MTGKKAAKSNKAQPKITTGPVLKVAVPGPFEEPLDYLWNGPPLEVGVRVRVPLGRRQVTGLVLDSVATSVHSNLKAVLEVLDEQAVMPTELQALVIWASSYYLHPLCDAVMQVIPPAIKSGQSSELRASYLWRVIDPPPSFGRASRLAQIWQRLAAMGECDDAAIEESGLSRPALRQMLERGWVSRRPVFTQAIVQRSPMVLSAEQNQAVRNIRGSLGSFRPWVLAGVTGSGKTEVYLRSIETVVEQGLQALVLVPEIALTPQTSRRFTERFPRTLTSHSNLTDAQRLQTYLRCLRGDVDVLVGTRSAVFAPLSRLGLIVVDEEHDPSFKQQDGFRYSGRDVAIKRAADRRIPIVLGSATPALETLANVTKGRFGLLRMQQRAGAATPAPIRTIDLRRQRLKDGLAESTAQAVEEQLAKGHQVLVFLNRRGYAPTLICPACGWIAECDACDARLTLHRQPPHLQCHHCDKRRSVPQSCPKCSNESLKAQGQATQRLEESLLQRFSRYPTVRIDRDVARSNQRLRDRLEELARGGACLLVGTQMIAKGHDFPNVTLVVIVNCDGGLFSADYRGPERTAQLIMQVAGRAGRREQPGEVWLQTYHPEHAVIQALVQRGYDAFADLALAERAAAGWPPFTNMAIIRGDATDRTLPLELLTDIRMRLKEIGGGVRCLGPVPAVLERRAGRHRFQLALLASNRSELHQVLRAAKQIANAHALARRVRVGIDVDPVDSM